MTLRLSDPASRREESERIIDELLSSKEAWHKLSMAENGLISTLNESKRAPTVKQLAWLVRAHARATGAPLVPLSRVADVAIVRLDEKLFAVATQLTSTGYEDSFQFPIFDLDNERFKSINAAIKWIDSKLSPPNKGRSAAKK